MDEADARRREVPFHNGAPIFSPTTVPTSQTLDHHLVNLHPRETLNLHSYHSKTLREDSNPDPLSFAFSPTAAPPPPSSAVRYRECLRNHAASEGRNVTDGCCEFMPSGDAGTLEYLKCAACDCHRNFHRKEFDSHSRNQLHLLPPPSPHIRGYTMVAPTPMNVAYGGGTDQSSSEDMEAVRPDHAATASGFMTKKRNRTKFTKEQKEKMWEFAEKLGWRIQRQNDEEVTSFCEGIGVRRQVFKVWMHNNKNNRNNGATGNPPPESDPDPIGLNVRVSPESEHECA